jgi:hypothetical protein
MSEVKLLDIEEIEQEVFTRWDPHRGGGRTCPCGPALKLA